MARHDLTWRGATAVDEHGVEDGLLEQPLLEPIVRMAVAPNGRFLACFARDGKLAVMSSNFATKVVPRLLRRGPSCREIAEWTPPTLN